jgi:hypothetical protein
MIVDERADERQREALQTIFGGRAGGWPKVFADAMLGNLLGLEFAPEDRSIAPPRWPPLTASSAVPRVRCRA